MPEQAPLDHEAFWAGFQGDDLLRTRTRDYAERARGVVAAGFLLQRYWHPWQQDVEGSLGCNFDHAINVFESAGEHFDLPNGIPVFETIRDYLLWWENTPKDPEASQPNKRIYIIKNMHPRVLELLGVLLDIPPEFFLAHCEEFATLNVTDRYGANDRGLTYWKVPVPRSYLPPNFDSITLPPDDTYSIKLGSIDRGEIELSSLESVTCTSFVSYWARRYGTNSWTAVLLCDPDQGTVHSSSDSRIFQTLNEFHANRDATRRFQHDRAFYYTTSQSRERVSKMLVDACRNRDPADDDHLHTAITFARNVIRSIWEAEVIRIVKCVNELQKVDGGTQKSNASQASSSYKGRVSAYFIYGKSIQDWHLVRQKKTSLHHIMRSFQCMRGASTHSDISASEEHESWAILEEMLDAADTTLGDYMAIYAQILALDQAEVAARQAEVAVRQARSAGQLTKIATFIVPCSFVASIFSMGGNFAAGERLFYIYWVVSIPVTVSLLMWVMINDPDRDRYTANLKRRVSLWSSHSQKEKEKMSRHVEKSEMSKTSFFLRRRGRKQEHQDIQA